MSLDLRIPMGLMFTLVGIILTAFGIATNSNTELYARCLGVNVNLWWGIVLLIFGQTMFQLGRRSQKRLAALPPPSEPDATEIRRGH
jgi:cytochrome c biogenesis protein CcdA